MSDCPDQSRIEAYHDRELSGAEAAALEAHLRECSDCAAEMARLRELSGVLATGRPEEILPIELARIHRAVERSDDRSLLRFSAAISAVAASVLIISSVWLLDGPQPRPMMSVNQHAQQSWERLAAGRPFEEPRETAVARVRDTTDWMVVGMGGRGSR
jgi:anti-sigma factor RsiW